MNTPRTEPEGHDYFGEYWEASALNHLTIATFARQVLTYAPEAEVIDPLAGSAPPVALRLKRDRLQRLFGDRRSERAFAPTPLTEKQLGQVLAALTGPETERVYPSAGGLGAVEVFALLNRVESPLGRCSARYLPGEHALAPIRGELPPPDVLDRLGSLEGNDPALLLIFAVRIDRLAQKYGERGGRFALIEVGHACQNVALRLASDGLSGYQLGGILDHDIEELLHLQGTPARVTLGYAIGSPAKS